MQTLKDRAAYAKAHTGILYLTEEEHTELRIKTTNLKKSVILRWEGVSVSVSDTMAVKHDGLCKVWLAKQFGR